MLAQCATSEPYLEAAARFEGAMGLPVVLSNLSQSGLAHRQPPDDASRQCAI
jgi:hypothetical protein